MNAKNAIVIMGRESPNKQCWECANSELPRIKEGGSRFYRAFLEHEFGTWHYDVPDECPCKGKGWIPKEGEVAK